MRPKLRWSVRPRFLLAFVLAAIIPLAAFAIVTYTRTSASLTKLESQDMHDQAAGVQAVLRDQAAGELDFLHEYAASPELWKSVRDGDLAWVRAHVTEQGAAQRRTAWPRCMTAAAGCSPPAAPRRRRPACGTSPWCKPLAKARQPPTWRRSAAACTWSPPSRCAPAPGQRPVRRHLRLRPGDRRRRPPEHQHVHRRQRQAGHLHQRHAYGGHRPRGGLRLSTFNPLDHEQSTFTEGSYTSQVLTLTDKQGHAVSLLKVSVPRHDFTNALSTMHGDIFWGSVAALALAAAIGLLMATGVSRPMRRLAMAAAAMANGDFRQRLSVGRDEIGSVAAAFNTMSEQVAQRMDELSRKTQGLSLEIANLNVVGTTLAQTTDVHAELRRLAAMIKAMFAGDYAAIYLQELPAA